MEIRSASFTAELIKAESGRRVPESKAWSVSVYDNNNSNGYLEWPTHTGRKRLHNP